MILSSKRTATGQEEALYRAIDAESGRRRRLGPENCVLEALLVDSFGSAYDTVSLKLCPRSKRFARSQASQVAERLWLGTVVELPYVTYGA